MDWIKRNLYFLIGGLVALALMGMAGFFLYSKWQQNNTVMDQLNADYEQLRQFNTQDPHPGAGDINNIELAKKQTGDVQALIQKARAQFKPIPPIPDVPKPTDSDFSSALAKTLEQMRREATNASVTLPQTYNFSFAAQNARMTYAPGSLGALAVQLGEVKALCDVLYEAKINSLDSIRREKVSTDDQAGSQTDYIEKKSTTNELAILSPYEVTFRGFSAELASVLSGLASSPHGLILKAINVELAPAAATTPTEAQPVAPQPVYYQQPIVPSGGEPRPGGVDPAAAAAFRRRYGIGGPGGRMTMQPQPQPQPPPVYAQPVTPAGTTTKSGLQTVLDEKQLKATLTIYVVKMLPPKEEGRQAPAKPQPNPAPPAQDSK